MQPWSENWEQMITGNSEDSIAHIEFLVCGQIPTCPSVDNLGPSNHAKDYFGEVDFNFTVNSADTEDANQRPSKRSDEVDSDTDKDNLEEFVKELDYSQDDATDTSPEVIRTDPSDEIIESTFRKKSPSRLLEARRSNSKRQRSETSTEPNAPTVEISSPPMSAISTNCVSPTEPLTKSKRLHTKRQRTPPLTKTKVAVKNETSEEGTSSDVGSRTLLRECKFVSKRSGCQCLHVPLITKHKRGYLSVVCGSGHQWVWCRHCCNCSTAKGNGENGEGGCNLKTHWFERDAFDTGRRNHMRNAHGQSPAFET